MTDRSIFTQSCTGEKHTHQCMDKDDENAKNLKMCFTAFYCCQNCLVFIKKKNSLHCFWGSLFFWIVPSFVTHMEGKAWTWESFAAFWVAETRPVMVWKPEGSDSNSTMPWTGPCFGASHLSSQSWHLSVYKTEGAEFDWPMRSCMRWGFF